MLFETSKDSTSKRIYSLLKEEIIQMRLTPGSNISEHEISEKFKVSRTPVREAFLRLAQEGLLSIYPQKGTFVSLIDLSLVEEARFLREHLERAVIKLACAGFPPELIIGLEMNLKLQEMHLQNHDDLKLFQADEEFHRLIFAGCAKKRIWQMINDMNSDFKRIRVLRLASNFDWDDIFAQHARVLQAIKDGNTEAGERAIQEHLTAVNVDKTELIDKYPGYFK